MISLFRKWRRDRSVKRLMHSDYAVERDPAVAALKTMGETRFAAEQLTTALSAKDSRSRKRAAAGLKAIGETRFAAEQLMATLQTKIHDRSIGAFDDDMIDALGHLGDPCAVELLIRIVEDSDSAYRQGQAAAALIMIGDRRAVTPILALLESGRDCQCIISDVRHALHNSYDRDALPPVVSWMEQYEAELSVRMTAMKEQKEREDRWARDHPRSPDDW